MGGGPVPIDFSKIHHLPIHISNLPPLPPPHLHCYYSSSSSSDLDFPVSASHAAGVRQPRTSGGDSEIPDSVDGQKDKKTGQSTSDNLGSGSSATEFEVDVAALNLQSFVHGHPWCGWVQPLMRICDAMIFGSKAYDGIYHTVGLLYKDVLLKRLLASLSSDQAIWDAMMSNKIVQKLCEFKFPADKIRLFWRCSNGDQNVAADYFVRQILGTPELKVTGLIQKSQALVNDLLQIVERRNSREETRYPWLGNNRSPMLLPVVIIVIILIARNRAHRA